MNMQGKSTRKEGLNVDQKVVIVAVKASKEIPRDTLVWALTHVAQAGVCVKLLVVIPGQSSNKLWGFRRFTSECIARFFNLSGTISDKKDYITKSCTQLMLQLQDVYDSDQTKVKVKIVSASHCGVVASEAKRAHTSWVVLDKRLTEEVEPCMEQLDCNVVMIKRSGPKVLRLNLVGSPKTQSEVALPQPVSVAATEHVNDKYGPWNVIEVPKLTPASSPEHTLFTITDAGTSSLSSSDLATSPYFFSEVNWDIKKNLLFDDGNPSLDESGYDKEREELGSPSMSLCSRSWIADILSSASEIPNPLVKHSQRPNEKAVTSFRSDALVGPELDRDLDIRTLSYRLDSDLNKSVRQVMLLSKNESPEPPPLCSLCQHKGPKFGKPPQWFTYTELEQATRGFSQANFLAEGGFGSVHRGVLPDGQVIAVKQYKLASSQGDREFCSEVEVLSCAQHRNVVMLIGFCVEDERRLLVYEYICNGSLDSHLYGCNRDPLEWSARQKIAVGAARGLRYLHEECRVGCIVHRDLRPNNILLTHDFEPLVGDFGLARWQPDGDLGVETRVMGTFGYLAPEYPQTGQITEKADVYSFGVVLVELVTGRKAMDVTRPKGQQCLTEWARPLLEKNVVHELIDPRLRSSYSEKEVQYMLRCASLCIRRDPDLRPRMCQVLRMLEGDCLMNKDIATVG